VLLQFLSSSARACSYWNCCFSISLVKGTGSAVP
jgi:hypothetical protein